MTEYIERESVMKIIDDYGCAHSGAVDVIGSAIYKLPAADVAPVKYGHWIQTNVFECSECEYSFEPEGYLPFFNYCPCCGARMDGGDPNAQM